MLSSDCGRNKVILVRQRHCVQCTYIHEQAAAHTNALVFCTICDGMPLGRFLESSATAKKYVSPHSYVGGTERAKPETNVRCDGGYTCDTVTLVDYRKFLHAKCYGTACRPQRRECFCNGNNHICGKHFVHECECNTATYGSINCFRFKDELNVFPDNDERLSGHLAECMTDDGFIMLQHCKQPTFEWICFVVDWYAMYENSSAASSRLLYEKCYMLWMM